MVITLLVITLCASPIPFHVVTETGTQMRGARPADVVGAISGRIPVP
jgi:hypothetical protein